jgi:hypothetical protein
VPHTRETADERERFFAECERLAGVEVPTDTETGAT